MEADTDKENHQEVSLVRLLFSAFLTFAVLVGIVFAYTPASIWEPEFVSKDYRQKVGVAFPQGWAFFTKPSSDPHLAPYSLDGESLEKTPAGLASNFFGISREGRAQVNIRGYENQ